MTEKRSFCLVRWLVNCKDCYRTKKQRRKIAREEKLWDQKLRGIR